MNGSYKGNKRRVLEELDEDAVIAGMGGLDSVIGRMGVVCHFNHEGDFTGCEGKMLDETGLEVGSADVAAVCGAVCAAFARVDAVGTGH